MKTLFLLRHARAVSGSDALRDLDRPLNNQGRRQAECVGKYLEEKNISFDLVLSSPARRANETTELVLTAAGFVTEVRYDQAIYEATRQQLLEVISEIEEEKTKVLLVGHNPGIEELLQRLTRGFESMGTGTLAKVDLKASPWTEAADQQGQLAWLVKPQELTGG